jgi:hypothetical protein
MVSVGEQGPSTVLRTVPLPAASLRGGAVAFDTSSLPLIPANAGTQVVRRPRHANDLHSPFNRSRPVIWVPAFAGMSGD